MAHEARTTSKSERDENMKNRRILVSGAGIAGLTLAYWLAEYGFEPTVVEIAPKLREGGYVIDFFGAGVEVAAKMGIESEIAAQSIPVHEIALVDERGRRKAGFSVEQLKRVTDGRFYSLLRSSLARIIHDALPGNVEFVFGDSIARIDQAKDGVFVEFESGKTRSFDLVVGADGLHSKVRRLVFGPEAAFEKFFGYYTSSFTVDDARHEPVFLSHTVPHRQVGTYSIDRSRAAAFFIFSAPEKLDYDHHDTAKQKEILRRAFADVGWRCPELLAKMDSAPDFYFDTVSQIRMDRWHEGRVTLVGDACDCPSLLSGQGSTLAMVGAYVLAGELYKAGGDHAQALPRYEEIFKPFMDAKQDIARKFAGSFVPKNRWDLFVRNTFTNLMFLPFVTRWLVHRFMMDHIELEVYG